MTERLEDNIGGRVARKSTRKHMEGPDSPTSVGWTEAKTIRLASAEEPLALEAGGEDRSGGGGV